MLYDNSGRELCRSRDVQELRRVMRATGAGWYWAMAFASDGEYDYLVARYRMRLQPLRATIATGTGQLTGKIVKYIGQWY